MVNFRYLVEIGGLAEVLKRLPGLLKGPDFEITATSDGRVYLSASSFETCTDPDEVAEAASHLLRRLASILQVYASARGDFTVRSVFWKDDRGHLKQRMRAIISVRVISSRGLNQLATSTTSAATSTSDLLSLSLVDDDVARAFDLIGGRDIGWYQIYDLIDVMGKVDGIVKRGWATRPLLSSIRQTANHYRHLGSISDSDKLPANPPHLNAARGTITNIFCRWLTERLAKAT